MLDTKYEKANIEKEATEQCSHLKYLVLGMGSSITLNYKRVSNRTTKAPTVFQKCMNSHSD
eukprot:903288-Ditylum_brightwellii.AAC.1